jgi:hypothetical protein
MQGMSPGFIIAPSGMDPAEGLPIGVDAGGADLVAPGAPVPWPPMPVPDIMPGVIIGQSRAGASTGLGGAVEAAGAVAPGWWPACGSCPPAWAGAARSDIRTGSVVKIMRMVVSF